MLVASIQAGSPPLRAKIEGRACPEWFEATVLDHPPLALEFICMIDTKLISQHNMYNLCDIHVPYSGKFRGRKLSRISWFWGYQRKPTATPTHNYWLLAIHESFLREFIVSHDSRKFSPSKVSRYTVYKHL